MKRGRLLALNLGGLAGCVLGLVGRVHGWPAPVCAAGCTMLGVLLAGLIHDRMFPPPDGDGR